MNGRVSKDVTRLILRYLATAYDARGLLGANHFWRQAVISYYEAAARTSLQMPQRLPLYHSLPVIRAQVERAPAANVVLLDVFWTRYDVLARDVDRLCNAYHKLNNVVNHAARKVTERTQQVQQGRWGYKRTRSRQANSETDEAWTRRMLVRAEKKYETIKAANDVDACFQKWQTQHKQLERLREHISTCYEAGSVVSAAYQPSEEPLRFMAQYPHTRRAIKRRLEETHAEHERALAADRELSDKCQKICAETERHMWPRLY